MKRALFLLSIIAALSISPVEGQSPTVTAARTPESDMVSLPAAIKLLQEMKTANEEVLKKQQAALQQLEELQKAADELKIFGKRS